MSTFLRPWDFIHQSNVTTWCHLSSFDLSAQQEKAKADFAFNYTIFGSDKNIDFAAPTSSRRPCGCRPQSSRRHFKYNINLCSVCPTEITLANTFIITCIFFHRYLWKYVQTSENTPVVAWSLLVHDRKASTHCKALFSCFLISVSNTWIYGLQLLGFRWYNRAVRDL